MTEFNRVDAPVFSPTYCRTCMNASDKRGFIDTGVADAAGFHIYVCATCVDTMARLVGCLDPKQGEGLRRALADSSALIEALERDLVEERANKVVPLADVLEIVKQKRKEPAAA